MAVDQIDIEWTHLRLAIWRRAGVLALGIVAAVQIGYPQSGPINVKALAIDPLTPSTLYAGTDGGVFKSSDGGDGWTAINSGLTAPSVQALAIDPTTPTTLYAGTSGGVFKSTNGGATWQNITGANASLMVGGGLALAIDPITPSTLYVGTLAFGVFKSTDGGTSWTAINAGFTASSAQTLAIDPSTTTTLYAGTDGGVFKSTNGGTSWAAFNSGLTAPTVQSLAVDPSTPTTLYAGAWNAGNFFTGGGVFKSSTGGNSWTALNSGITATDIQALAIDPSTTATLYAGTFGSNVAAYSVFKSTNGGAAWAAASSGLPAGSNVQALAIDPSTSATLYAGTDSGVYKSTDGGTTWLVTGAGAPACTYAISPSGGQVFYYPEGANGGTGTVTVTAGSGCAWTAASNSSFLAITSGSSGSGNGVVGFSVAANTGSSQRTGTLTIAGQTFTVTQAGTACIYAISPTSQSFSASSGTGVVSVTASAICQWNAVSNDGFISIIGFPTGITAANGNGSLEYGVQANTTANSSQRTGTLTIAGQTFTVTQAGMAASSPPTIQASGIVNAAAYGALSPGALASIFGANLAGTTASASTTPLPTNLSNASVTVNGTSAPLLYVGPTQINFQVPWSIPVGNASVVVTVGSTSSAVATVPVLAAAPGLFIASGSPFVQQNQALVQNSDFSLNTPNNPALAGSTIVAYLTGTGAVNPPVATGAAAPLTSLSYLALPYSATLGSANAAVAFAGLAPGFVGVTQMNIVVPPGFATGNYLLSVTANGQTSNANTVSVIGNGTAATCVQYPTGFIPFTSVYYVSSPDSAGDQLLVGASNFSNFQEIQSLPLPNQLNQQFCGTVILANGYSVVAYVPTAQERTGNFSAFSTLLIDPATDLPFPGGFIPQSRLPDPFAWRIVAAPGSFPALSISKSHTGDFVQGQMGAIYTINVSEAASAGPTNGTVTVTEALPTGLTLVSMAGSGWSCSGTTCTRGDVLRAGSAYPPVVVTINVSSTAASQVTNRATVSGGGSAPATASDATNVVAMAAAQVTTTAAKDAFTSQTGPNTVVTFDDVPVNSFVPFVSDGVSFPMPNSASLLLGTQPQVLSSLLNSPFSFWFPNDGSGSQFLLTGGSLVATFPTDVHAVGFDYSCFSCSASPTDRVIQWQLLSASGAVVDSGTTVADFTSGLHFFGLQSSAVFRSISVIGDTSAGASSGGNWLADNIRYAQ